MAEEYGVK